MFLQLHALNSFPSSLLNRDEVGLAKRIQFGGVERSRISSQCLKMHWRSSNIENGLNKIDFPKTIRSRLIFDQKVAKPLRDEGLDEDIVFSVVFALMKEVTGDSAKAKDARQKAANAGVKPVLESKQPLVIGEPEVDYLKSVARKLCKEVDSGDDIKAEKALQNFLGNEGRKNLQALRKGAGLDACLFGRMVTSDPGARVDSAVHVAHALTVHKIQCESDFFAVVDQLKSEGNELGSGHIGNVELTTGLYYSYVVVDVPQLVSNINGSDRNEWKSQDLTIAAQVVSSLVYMIATVSPGAKLGSTAPYAYASMILAESGTAQPCSLANAFLTPVPERDDMLQAAYKTLAQHIKQIDAMYNPGNVRRFAAMGPVAELEDAMPEANIQSVNNLAQWMANQIKEG